MFQIDSNLTTTVHFDQLTAHFSYFCSAASAGWQVTSTGNIMPPSESKVLRFEVRGTPELPRFAGFQIFKGRHHVPPEDDFWPTPPDGIEVLFPKPYPKGHELVTGPLIFDFSGQTSPLHYRLAVAMKGGKIYWDDPKIYDDGTIHSLSRKSRRG
ncbi:MAG: hypothetical protein AAF604_06615 [Acidobacteriota bacterium]